MTQENNLVIDINKLKTIITDYKQTCELFSNIINCYVADNFEDWKHFNGWEFSNNGENIILHYSYKNFLSNTEYCTDFDTETVSLETILDYNEMSQVYNK